MESLSNKEHLGVLTESPITDLEITLVGGREAMFIQLAEIFVRQLIVQCGKD